MEPTEARMARWALGPRVANGQPQKRGDPRAECGDDPGGVVRAGVEHGLADEWADGQAEVKRKREVTDRFAAPLLGCEVVDDARRADVEARLTDPRQKPQQQ